MQARTTSNRKKIREPARRTAAAPRTSPTVRRPPRDASARTTGRRRNKARSTTTTRTPACRDAVAQLTQVNSAGAMPLTGESARLACCRRRLGDDHRVVWKGKPVGFSNRCRRMCSAGRRTPQASGLRSSFPLHRSGSGDGGRGVDGTLTEHGAAGKIFQRLARTPRLTSATLSGPHKISTSVKANSIAVPALRLVTTLPSTTTRSSV